MGDRSLLGPADVDAATFTGIVARALGEEPHDVTVLESAESVVAYSLDAITTAGRYWVTARAVTPGGERSVRLFVKHVQSWSRSPFFQFVPEELRAMAATSVPWRTEPLVYGSDLHHRLPPGLTMPVALHVDFLDDSSAAIWLPSLDVVDHQWDTADFVRAAHLLGRLAGSPAVAELAELGDADGGPRTARTYANGRLAVQVAPALRSEELWRAPWLADAFDADLRAALLAETEAACLPAYVEGLRAEGVAVDRDTVARVHALHLLLFTGLSAPLMDPAAPGAGADALAGEARERAAISRFCLGLVATT